MDSMDEELNNREDNTDENEFEDDDGYNVIDEEDELVRELN